MPVRHARDKGVEPPRETVPPPTVDGTCTLGEFTSLSQAQSILELEQSRSSRAMARRPLQTAFNRGVTPRGPLKSTSAPASMSARAISMRSPWTANHSADAPASKPLFFVVLGLAPRARRTRTTSNCPEARKEPLSEKIAAIIDCATPSSTATP